MPSSPLQHLALVMDGNGRWAEKHNHSRIFGHVRGAKTTRKIIKHCSKIQLPFLSLFALSTENAFRPKKELIGLKKLLEKSFLQHSDLLIKEKIKLHVLGDLSIFSKKLQDLCKELCHKTKNYKGLNLIVALNYGGRQEIVNAIKKATEKVKKKQLELKDLNEKSLSPFFCSSAFPPPDLIIRTGGQMRLSNFYLWSSAYSELYFTKTLWPDFNEKSLDRALKHFSSTKRQFGKI